MKGSIWPWAILGIPLGYLVIQLVRLGMELWPVFHEALVRHHVLVR